MSEAVEKLKPLVNALTPAERGELAIYLDGLADPDGEELTEAEWEAEWSAEIERRLDDIRTGKVTPLDGDEVMRQFREKYG